MSSSIAKQSKILKNILKGIVNERKEMNVQMNSEKTKMIRKGNVNSRGKIKINSQVRRYNKSSNNKMTKVRFQLKTRMMSQNNIAREPCRREKNRQTQKQMARRSGVWSKNVGNQKLERDNTRQENMEENCRTTCHLLFRIEKAPKREGLNSTESAMPTKCIPNNLI